MAFTCDRPSSDVLGYYRVHREAQGRRGDAVRPSPATAHLLQHGD
jgi:hypothetical protein